MNLGNSAAKIGMFKVFKTRKQHIGMGLPKNGTVVLSKEM